MTGVFGADPRLVGGANEVRGVDWVVSGRWSPVGERAVGVGKHKVGGSAHRGDVSVWGRSGPRSWWKRSAGVHLGWLASETEGTSCRGVVSVKGALRRRGCLGLIQTW